MKFRFVTFSLLAGMTILSACEVGPDYKPPVVEAPAGYKEVAKDWQPAKPNDDLDRGAWWSVYKDPALDKLEKQVEISNQNLKAAEAAWRQARAIVDESRSSLFPTVGLNDDATRSGGGNQSAGKGKTITSYNLSAGASWEPDIWGKIRRTIEGDIASAQAGAADIALARLSAQGTLATDYFTLRAQDELKRLLDETVIADRRALKIVQNQYNEGIAAKADVLTAQTQLEGVQAQAINVNVQRAQLEHAIAVLVGKPPAALTITRASLAKNVPKIPVGLPSALLERRPDIAATERQMAAANAEIGVAVAAWFPDLTLSGSYGYSGVKLANMFAAPFSVWSFGPAIAETLFDAGLREAQVEAAHAGYDQTVANYRQTVLTGFQQVEDQLAAIHWLSEQSKVETQVVADARKAEELELNQYKAGTVPYSSVLTAQTARLANEQTALAVRQNRFVATVALIEALGGGWNMAELGNDTQPGDKQKAKPPENELPVTVPDKLIVQNPVPEEAPLETQQHNPHIAGVTIYADRPADMQAEKVSNINRAAN